MKEVRCFRLACICKIGLHRTLSMWLHASSLFKSSTDCLLIAVTRLLYLSFENSLNFGAPSSTSTFLSASLSFFAVKNFTITLFTFQSKFYQLKLLTIHQPSHRRRWSHRNEISVCPPLSWSWNVWSNRSHFAGKSDSKLTLEPSLCLEFGQGFVGLAIFSLTLSLELLSFDSLELTPNSFSNFSQNFPLPAENREPTFCLP